MTHIGYGATAKSSGLLVVCPSSLAHTHNISLRSLPPRSQCGSQCDSWGGMLQREARHEAASTGAALPAKLQALLPEADPPAIPEALLDPAVQASARVLVTEAVLEGVLPKLPKGSAGGPSGWTYEHVKVVARSSSGSASAVRRLLGVMVSGQLPQLPELTDSRLIALVKPDGGVRPIAIGEVFYRLAGAAGDGVVRPPRDRSNAVLGAAGRHRCGGGSRGQGGVLARRVPPHQLCNRSRQRAGVWQCGSAAGAGERARVPARQ